MNSLLRFRSLPATTKLLLAMVVAVPAIAAFAACAHADEDTDSSAYEIDDRNPPGMSRAMRSLEK